MLHVGPTKSSTFCPGFSLSFALIPAKADENPSRMERCCWTRRLKNPSNRCRKVVEVIADVLSLHLMVQIPGDTPTKTKMDTQNAHLMVRNPGILGVFPKNFEIHTLHVDDFKQKCSSRKESFLYKVHTP